MLKEQRSQLPHLIRFGVPAFGLQGNYFEQVRHLVDVMTAPDSLFEAESQHQRSEVAKADVGIRLAAQNPSEQALVAIQCEAPCFTAVMAARAGLEPAT